MELDHIDKQILNILMKDANTTYVDIAKQVHVSPGTVHVRMKNLRQVGVVQGATLNVNYSLLGLNMIAFLGITLERSSMYTEVLQQLQRIPEVIKVNYTTGPYNMFAQVVCKDSQDLYEILNHQIQEIKGVQQTESFISLNEGLNRPVDIIRQDGLL